MVISQSSSVIAGSPRDCCPASVRYVRVGVEYFLGAGGNLCIQKNSKYHTYHPGSESTEVSPVGRVGEHPRPTSKVPKFELSAREGREISQTARRLA